MGAQACQADGTLSACVCTGGGMDAGPGDGGSDSGTDAPMADGPLTDNTPADTPPTDAGFDAGPSDSGALRFTQIVSGLEFSCALRSDRTVWCWGDNALGQLGVGNRLPELRAVQVMGLTDATYVAAGGQSACAVRAMGRVSCWGSNSGQFGFATPGDGVETRPVDLPGVTSVAQVALGHNHLCVLTDDGFVRCAGSNSSRELGDGTAMPRTGFVMASEPRGAIGIRLGRGYSCALRSRSVSCWGDESSGQLGTGGGAGTVVGLTDPVELSLAPAGASACARRMTGTVVCWGRGPLGDGTSMDRPTPTPVMGLTDATHVAAGGTHSCALSMGRGLLCWGDGTFGQFGDGTTEPVPALAPVAVPAVTGVQSLSVGSAFTCAIRTDGVYCWGRNHVGQLGSGSTTNSSVPVRVAGL